MIAHQILVADTLVALAALWAVVALHGDLRGRAGRADGGEGDAAPLIVALAAVALVALVFFGAAGFLRR